MTPEERFSIALHGAARNWRLAVDRRLKGLGMSQASWVTVAVVAKAAAPLSQIELAQSVGVEGATMVSMLDRLEKAGLVMRQPVPNDRRMKHVVLTPQGRALYDEVRQQADPVRRELLGGVDPALLRAATVLLEQVQAAAEAMV